MRQDAQRTTVDINHAVATDSGARPPTLAGPRSDEKTQTNVSYPPPPVLVPGAVRPRPFDTSLAAFARSEAPVTPPGVDTGGEGREDDNDDDDDDDDDADDNDDDGLRLLARAGHSGSARTERAGRGTRMTAFGRSERRRRKAAAARRISELLSSPNVQNVERCNPHHHTLNSSLPPSTPPP
ncbi:unnamed protein product [Lampetra fluviatilis]